MGDPSNVNQSFRLSSDSVSSEATFIVSPSSPMESQLWQNPIYDAQLRTPVGSGKRIRVSVNKCHVCRKEFKTNSALKTHLLLHRHDRLHICGVCQRVFSHNHQLTSHMMTHHKRKTYHKTYDDKNSLKHHCDSQHLTTPSSSCHVSNYDLPASLCKPTINHTSDCHGLFISHPKPIPAPALKSPNFSGKPFGSHDIGELGLGCYKEDTYSSHVKYSTQAKHWTLESTGESCKVKERTKLPTPTQWTLVSDIIAEDPVVLQNPFDVNSLETSLDFFESYTEEWKKMLSFQPNKEAATSSMVCPARPHASVCPKKDFPILVKDSLKQTKPSNKLKQQHSISNCNPPAFCPKPKSGFNYNLPAVPSSSAPLPSSRNRKSCSKIPGSPLPVPQPTRHAHLQSHPSLLVSSSQVVLASFNPFPGNPFFQKEVMMKPAGDEPNYSRRTSSACRAQSKPSCSQEALASDGTKQEHDLQSSSTPLVEGQKGTSRPKQKSRGIKLSPLIIPVSVPVSTPNTLASQDSTQQARRSQECKGTPKRSHHLDPLNCLVIPSPAPPHPSTPQCTHDQETPSLLKHCGTGGFPSQLRSPAYLAEHPLSPQPYTPQPMLSPLRPGTGLYFKSLPQYQPCPSVPNTPGVAFQLDNTIVNIQPKINIGSRFQAEIPPLRDTFYLLYEEHPAQLVWTPWKDLSTNTETQQRVKELIDLCCSSVLPGGGTNIELALHCLHEVQGNITAALDLLLMRGDFRTACHPLNSYHYTGSDSWTAQEMKLFKKALDDYDKDFRQIHNVVQTKSLAQCVEYYYNMKQLKKFKQRGRAVNKKCGGGENTKAFKFSQEHQLEQTDKNKTTGDTSC